MTIETMMRKKAYVSPVCEAFAFCGESPLMNMSPADGQHNPGEHGTGPEAEDTRQQRWNAGNASQLWED
ncbi:hypothetical protein HMPREF9332_01543 [Alloprevotella rava F0323]|uniref:Uncharacterized protein n=1 Tax=Alloprevotella rava F0323 TaxID=679199 RepID=G5GDB4_9BACT|nr:hypothetical protein [Alloprevotella rava]EHG22028.1 hypothetical protein HMPREF9332_01543 [Alloprevotella rava F0323]